MISWKKDSFIWPLSTDFALPRDTVSALITAIEDGVVDFQTSEGSWVYGLQASRATAGSAPDPQHSAADSDSDEPESSLTLQPEDAPMLGLHGDGLSTLLSDAATTIGMLSLYSGDRDPTTIPS